ncbi:hypothetical protein BH20VER3_BH20VER3_10380 [soil metagenome]
MPGTNPNTILTLCLALCLCSACDNPEARRLSIRVLAVDGKAQRLRSGGESSLQSGIWVSLGEKITVAPGGRVDLMILPGIWAELEGDSELQLEALLLERNGDDWIHPMRKREATVRLLRGSLYFALQQSQTRSRLIVHTPVGTVFAGAGRAGKIEARSQQVSVLSARDEIVFDATAAQRLHIPAGYLLEWPGLATEPSPGAQAEVRKVMEVRKHLFTLADQTVARFSLAPEPAGKRRSQPKK